MKTPITYGEYGGVILALANKIKKSGKTYSGLFPVPRGGYLAAIELGKALDLPIRTQVDEYCLIVDDLIDSGTTLAKYRSNDKAVVFMKNHAQNKSKVTFYGAVKDGWLVFPDEKKTDIQDHLARVLQYIGEDTTREGLIETPARMEKSYRELFAGYNQDPKKILKCFTDGACHEMVVLKNCEFYSTCEHHFLPFYGSVSIAYIPNGKVAGISKLARLVDCFARRLQIQERMTSQIADCIMDVLGAGGVYVVCEAQHLCMKSRGVGKQTASMVTSAVRGRFKEQGYAAQFLSIVGNTGGGAM